MTAVSSSLVAIGGAACLAVLIYWPWQDLCTAFARQILFEKRDALFDLAKDGKLSFRDPDYRAIRALLEKNIRFAHEITIPRLLFYYITLRHNGVNLGKRPALLLAVDRIQDADTRRQVARLVKESINTLLFMSIFKSPVVMFLLIPSFVILFIAQVGKRFARALRERFQTVVLIEAESVGSSLDSALA